jgi:hypothetical protein
MAAAGTITLTRVQFELEIKALLEALSRVVNFQAEDGLGISKHCAVSSPNDTKDLIHWERQTTQDGHLYLIHPTEIRTLETSAENDVCIEDDLYDVSVDQEDERIVSQPQPLEVNSHDKCTEWFFSIVLSDTWLVPVLYFRVQRMDGTPCLRQDILSYCNHDDLGVKDSWDFISQEEHAITGEPSFFLHPCQTSARLAKLQTNNPDTKDSARVPGTLLLSFLSMILPAVRSRISPTNYSRIYHELLQIAANDNTNR